MALTVTSLNGAITQSQTQIKLTAFTNPASGGIGPKALVVLDGAEVVQVEDASLSPVLSVVRGFNGTAATAHNTLAPVVYGLTSDFTTPANVTAATGYSYGADGTITNPAVDATIYIDKATAAALTLTDPNADQTNTVKFVSLTAAAHTITYATGFYDNTTSSDVATFPATAGAAFTIKAMSGKWRPVATADDGVTIA